MRLAFDTELIALRDEFRKPLAGATLRSALEWIDTGATMDQVLWARLSQLGWLGTVIPAEHGGSGIDELMLCLQAEEIGRALAPIPFTASACGYAAGLALAADADAQASLLPAVVAGSAVGVLLTDGCWRRSPRLQQSSQADALIDGVTGNVLDGACATAAIARVGQGAEATLVHIDLSGTARSIATDCLDPLHPCASFDFERTPARVLTRGENAEAVWQQIEDRYALFTAFEQIGAAGAALEMARQYALERHAFGRPIGSFQGLKHTFADLFASLDLARSNCLYGAAALNSATEQLHEAAAVARISATEAFRRCARGNLQVHGALGVTWDSGCHLYYRRAQALAGHPGSIDDWKDRLVQSLLERSCDLGIAASTDHANESDRYPGTI